MSRLSNRSVLAGLLLLTTSAASAAKLTKTNEWIGASGDWSDVANWSFGHMPAADELAWFNPTKEIKVTVNDDYAPGAFSVGAGSVSAPIVFSGTGKVTVGNNSPAPYIRANHPFTLDGVTLDVGSLETLWYSPVTLKNGGAFKTTRRVYLWTKNANVTIDGGALQGGSLNASAGVSVDLTSGELTCDDFNVTAASGFCLNVSGGVMTVKGTPTLSETATLNLIGGELVFTQPLTERRFLTGTKGTTIRVTGTTSGHSIFLSAEPNEVVTFGASVFASGSIYITNAPNVTVKLPESATLGLNIFAQAFAGGDSGLDARTVVFGEGPAFIFGGSGASGERRRYFSIQGPVTFRPTADMKMGTSGVYPAVLGDLVIDTTDAADSTVGRDMQFQLMAAEHSTLTVRGLGSATVMQKCSATPFSKIEVESGATLSLAVLTGAVASGPLNTDRFVLGPNATLKIPGGSNFVQAASWQIDPTAKIVIDVPEGITAGALRALNDLAGSLSSAGQIELTGAGASGWSTSFANGSLVLTKSVGSVDGKYTCEWTGLGSDNAFLTAENWFNGSAPVSGSGDRVYFGAGCEKRNVVEHSNAFGLAGLTFRETASKPYSVNGSSYFTVSDKTAGSASQSSVVNLSALPMTINRALRSLTNISATAADGSLLLMNSNGLLYRTTGTFLAAGDIRLGGSAMKTGQLCLACVESADHRKTTGTLLTILSGGSLTVSNQTATLNSDAKGTDYQAFRVNAGGTLTFNGVSDAAQYDWNTKPTKLVVDGELAINIPFVGHVDQTYGGAGTVRLSTVAPTTSAAIITLSDSVVLEPASDWTTVATADDQPLTLASEATPTIRLSADWTYGAAADSGTSTEASSRALTVGRDAVLTVDAKGHVATFADPVTGEGVLAITNGTMRLASGTDVASVRLDPTGIFDVASDLTVSSLNSNGGTLRIGSGAVLTCTEGADVSGLRVKFADGVSTGWTTVLAAGEIAGTPSGADGLQYRTVELSGVKNLQCRPITGLLILVR